MKALMIGLTVFSCAVAAWGEVFQMDRKGDSVVEVKKSGDEYRVVCKFKPQSKFDKAVNAKFNDAKGDSLCKKGLARYLNVAKSETLVLSGLYVTSPVENIGGRLCYSFAVPVSGCRASKNESRLSRTGTSERPVSAASKTPQTTTDVALAKKSTEDMSKSPSASKNVCVMRSSSYVCVAKYKEVNGKRTTVSHREYQGRNFNSREEFNRFCQQEFARIRAIGDANLRAVRDSVQ